jgi:hypothetical protein
MKEKTMKLLLMFLVALGILARAPAYAATPCKGEVISADGKLTVGKCWTDDTDAQELIAMACGEGDKCEVYGTITRAREIKRVDFATGPKGMSFKMKPCPKCIGGMEKALDDLNEQQR